MHEYVLKVKKITDALAAIGASVSTDDHIEAILDGLGEEYTALVIAVLSKSDSYIVDKLEALLMAMEERIEKSHRSDLSLVQANLAQTILQDGVQKNAQENGGRSGGGGKKGCGRGQGGRSHWQNSGRPQCQVCNKYGHTAWQCYHKFDQAFPNCTRTLVQQPPPPPPSSFHNPSATMPRAYLAKTFHTH